MTPTPEQVEAPCAWKGCALSGVRLVRVVVLSRKCWLCESHAQEVEAVNPKLEALVKAAKEKR